MADDVFMSLIEMGFDAEAAMVAVQTNVDGSLDDAIQMLLSQGAAVSPHHDPLPSSSHTMSVCPPIMGASSAHQEGGSGAEEEEENDGAWAMEDDNDDMDVTYGTNKDSERDPDEDGAFQYEDDDELYNIEDPEIGKQRSNRVLLSKRSFREVADQEQVLSILQREVQTIAELLSIDFATAFNLLKHFGWNEEKLTQKFIDDPIRTLAEAGIDSTHFDQITSDSIDQSSHQSNDNATPIKMCPICSDDVTAETVLALPCNHQFCRSCWREHVRVMVSDGKSDGIECMAHKCKQIVPLDIVQQLLEPAVYKKYLDYLAGSFVSTHPFWRWCPQPSCSHALRSDGSQVVLHCVCGFKSCFHCAKESHVPATCYQMTQWEAKNKDESETYNWLKLNTQDCPKCKTAIEKNGGCNHMTCIKCRHEFCWICNGDWNGHSSCNRFVDTSTPIGQRSSKDNQDRESLNRYLHYFHRYMVHEKSGKMETALREVAVANMEKLHNVQTFQRSGTPADAILVLTDATENLIECRRVLKHTYVFGFYLTEGAEKNLFEFLQEQLEETTDRLAGLLEAPADEMDPDVIEMCSNVAAKRLLNLLENIDLGLTANSMQLAEGGKVWQERMGSHFDGNVARDKNDAEPAPNRAQRFGSRNSNQSKANPKANQPKPARKVSGGQQGKGNRR
eukprot:GILK01004033.1.p1 GENE.GILK01004033.1~~GILK01004033.1.p1  ORF type:complete len:689 (+),score=140.78 GILK01004033.1:43-2067(+)